MKTNFIASTFAILLVSLCLAIPANAAPAQSARVTVCLPPYTVVATASIGVGDINFCLYYPEKVQPGSTFKVLSVLTAPPTVAPVFLTAANAFAAGTGCTEGTPGTFVPTTNGVAGTMWTATTFITMTAEQCNLEAAVALTIGAMPLQIYNTGIDVLVETENVRVDSFNFLCDAPGIAPNAYSTTGTVCDDLTLALAGTINAVVSGGMSISGSLTIADDSNGWVIHQDPISGELEICPMESPCFVESNSTISINGNVSINQTNLPSTPKPGFNGSLYILIIIIVAALAHLGEIRQDNHYRIAAGFLLVLAPFAMIWERENLGLNHIPGGDGLGLALPLLFVHWAIAIYFFYPKKFNEKEEPK